MIVKFTTKIQGLQGKTNRIYNFVIFLFLCENAL